MNYLTSPKQTEKDLAHDRRFATKKCFSTILCMLFASTAHASVTHLACVDTAAKRFEHNPKILRALIEIESSGKCPKRHAINTNGSYDIGCMGINSSWLPQLQRKFGLTEQDLYDPCTNINIGAWVLAKNIRTFGDHWRAIGAYNATSETKRIKYAWKVNAKLAELQQSY